MVLAPADFYAYSRATGVPVPEDPEEKAQIAPEVLAFRRNQLVAPREESNLLQNLGLAAAGLGLAGLGAFGARRLLRRQPAAAEELVSGRQPSEEAVRQVAKTSAIGNVVRDLNQPPTKVDVEPSKTVASPPVANIFSRAETPSSFLEFSQEAKKYDPTYRKQIYAVTAAKPASALPTIYRPKGGLQDVVTNPELAETLMTDPRTGEIFRRGQSPTSFAQTYIGLRPALRGQKTDLPLNRTPGSFLEFSQSKREPGPEPETLVTNQQDLAVQQTNQTLNAVESGEDQMTGRVKTQLQRNEDYDLSQLEVLENIAEQNRIAGMEQDEPINKAASQMPDGLPLDQAETTPSSFAQKQMMQVRMNQMRQQLEQEGYRGLALEKKLASITNLKQASELYAATGDPNVLSLAGATPSLPLSVKPQTNLQLGQSKTSFIGEDVPTSSYYEPFKQRESESGALVNADIHYTNQISNISAKLEGTPELIDNPDYVSFIEQTNMAMHAMRQGDPTGTKIFARNKALLSEGKVPVSQIKNPEYQTLQNELNYAVQSRENVRQQQTALELQAKRFPMIQKVTQTGEGSRLFAEIDPITSEPIPGTVELRSGRPALRGGAVSSTATGRAIRGRVGAEGTTAGPTPGIFEPSSIVTEAIFKPETARFRGETTRGTYEAADAGKGLQYEAQPVLWDPNIHLPEQRTPEGFVYSEEAMLKPSQPVGRERNLGPTKAPASVSRPSVDISSALRELQLRSKPGELKNPQTFLQEEMSKRGISAIGEFSPWPRRSR